MSDRVGQDNFDNSGGFAVSGQWCILTTRNGRDVGAPTDQDLAQALGEVFATQDPEHPSAWLRLGHDEGPMFVLDVYESGTILFEQWADLDFDVPLAPPVTLVGVRPELALALWRSLRGGDVDAVRRMAAGSTARPAGS